MTLTSHLVNANLWGITQVASIKISDLQPADSESFLKDLTDAELAVKGGLINNFDLFDETIFITDNHPSSILIIISFSNYIINILFLTIFLCFPCH